MVLSLGTNVTLASFFSSFESTMDRLISVAVVVLNLKETLL